MIILHGNCTQMRRRFAQPSRILVARAVGGDLFLT